jgi:hypothetical protein
MAICTATVVPKKLRASSEESLRAKTSPEPTLAPK